MLRFISNRLTIQRRNGKKKDKLYAADVVILRYPKSGVTWLRLMVSHIYMRKLGEDIPYLIGHSEFERRAPDCPSIFVAMDNIGLHREEMLSRFEGKKVVLLLRDPRDIAVSLYFHFTKRSTRQERLSYSVPNDIANKSLFDFVMDPDLGLARIIEFEEFWRKEIEFRPESIVLHYEDLKEDTKKCLALMMELIGTEVSAKEIADAVAFSSLENMKRMEARRSFAAGPLKPRNVKDADSFKVRKGKVGGYKDYFSAAELTEIEYLMRTRSSRTTKVGAP